MKQHKLFQLLTVVFFLSTCALFYLLYISPAEKLPAPQTPRIEVKVLPESSEEPSPEKPQISQEEIQRLLDVENEQKELILLFERVSADLKDTTRSKEILEQLLLGRTILRDFGKRFLNHNLFRKSGGFLSYMRKKTKNYLSDGKLVINPAGIKKKELALFRKEMTSWLLTRSDAEIEAVARFLSFFFAETLYDIPMTMLASRMTPELEEIDYNSPVLLKKVLTTASRDSNGEMNEKGPTSIEKYTMSQQFFFRRGPQITGKAVVFLKAYLSYTDI
ncbi:MAG: hypothetical protein MAG581_00626 [Deltaproteobacteria bacterium]|nr:hypothetical protein [Deltaproteobacteria bacterium]